jgi:hypothetical protein
MVAIAVLMMTFWVSSAFVIIHPLPPSTFPRAVRPGTSGNPQCRLSRQLYDIQEQLCLSDIQCHVFSSSFLSATNAWSNPASERLKSMMGAALWGVPLAIFLVVVLIAILSSVIMFVIDDAFYEQVKEEVGELLPDLLAKYEKERLGEGEKLSSRADLQMELYDQLLEYKANVLREMCLGENSVPFLRSLWHDINAQLEEEEDLDDRPDLIIRMELSIMKFRTNGDSSDVTEHSTIVDDEVGLDWLMRVVDNSTEFPPESRLAIYKDWELQKRENQQAMDENILLPSKADTKQRE